MIEMFKPKMITEKKGAKPLNYDNCKRILAKHPATRSEAECHQLQSLVKNVKFFQQMDPLSQLELCKVMVIQDVAWARETYSSRARLATRFT